VWLSVIVMGFLLLLLGRLAISSIQLRSMDGEAIGSDASDHDGELRFAHCGFSLTVRFMREDGRARGRSISCNNPHGLFRFSE